MSDPNNLLEAFHQAAEADGLEYLLIGGFAVSHWATPRFTADVDYVICESSYEQSQRVLAQLGYHLLFIHPKKSFAHFGRRDGIGFRIDLMIVNEDTWKQLKTDSSLADLAGSRKYPIVSPRHLIAMKFHAAKQIDRTDALKDLNDIAEIMLSQKIEIDELENDGILSKHGTEKTISQLRSILDIKRKS